MINDTIPFCVPPLKANTFNFFLLFQNIKITLIIMQSMAAIQQAKSIHIIFG